MYTFRASIKGNLSFTLVEYETKGVSARMLEMAEPTMFQTASEKR